MRGRNSDNTLFNAVHGWTPQTKLEDGLRKTYAWIKEQIRLEREKGNTEDFIKSKVVKQTADALDTLEIDGC